MNGATGPSTEPEPAPTGPQLFEKLQGVGLPDLGRSKAALNAPPPGRTTNRRIESSLPPRAHVLPVPNGWYSILRSADLEPGDIVSIRLVGRPLVVFRDEDGVARVFDAHCPHMGAHLGGGRVDGERIQCPYHGWRFGGDGICVEIPYSDSRIPSRARIHSYPVEEKDGITYFWYHAGDAEPNYEVPDVWEVADPGWSDPYPYDLELVAALQEMAENNVDYAHFRYVHGRDYVPLEQSEHRFDGPLSWVQETLFEGLTFDRHSYGPGIAVLRFPDLMTILATTTPIDRGNCRLLWHFFFPRRVEASSDDLMLSVVGPYGLQADVPIWRDMKYQEHPVLVKGDGPLAEYRRWYAQFYEGN